MPVNLFFSARATFHIYQRTTPENRPKRIRWKGEKKKRNNTTHNHIPKSTTAQKFIHIKETKKKKTEEEIDHVRAYTQKTVIQKDSRMLVLTNERASCLLFWDLFCLFRIFLFLHQTFVIFHVFSFLYARRSCNRNFIFHIFFFMRIEHALIIFNRHTFKTDAKKKRSTQIKCI